MLFLFKAINPKKQKKKKGYKNSGTVCIDISLSLCGCVTSIFLMDSLVPFSFASYAALSQKETSILVVLLLMLVLMLVLMLMC